MSEFGQLYRVYGVNEEEIRRVLDGIKGWSVGEVQTHGQLLAAFYRTKTKPELTDSIQISSSHEGTVTTLNLWNLDMGDDLIAALNSQKHTYLTHTYHTGAGFDELCVYVNGELALTEDLGEIYEFSTENGFADLEFDYDREDERGRSFLKVEPPIREAELKKLTEVMGPSSLVLYGWEECISEGLPLYYLPGLD